MWQGRVCSTSRARRFDRHCARRSDTITRIRKPDPQLLEFLSRYDPKVRELLLAVRQLVLREIPSVSETVNDVSYAVTVGFTFSGRFKEAFCYVVAYSSYVNLGFPRGTELPDSGVPVKSGNIAS